MATISELIAQNINPVLKAFFGDGSFITKIITDAPLVAIFVMLLPALAILGIALFVDFIKDAWKMPFAIALDIAAFVLFAADPFYMFILALIAAGVFFILTIGQSTFRWIYAGIALARMILLIPSIPLPEELKVLLVTVPVCTIAMFFGCITD